MGSWCSRSAQLSPGQVTRAPRARTQHSAHMGFLVYSLLAEEPQPGLMIVHCHTRQGPADYKRM
jgi:hypothetical protein